MKTSLIMFKLLLRNLLKNWKQLISLFCISFLAICLFSGLYSNAMNIKNRTEILHDGSNLADVYLTMQRIDEEKYNSLFSLDGIKKINRRIYAPIKYDNVLSYLYTPLDSEELSTPIIKEGEKGVLVTSSFLENYALKIGDTISITIDSTYLSSFSEITNLLDNFVLDGKENVFKKGDLSLNFTITGTMYFIEACQSANFSAPSFYIQKDELVSSFLNVLNSNFDVEKISSFLAIFSYDIKTLLNENIDSLASQVLITTANTDTTILDVEELFSSSDDLLAIQKGEDISSIADLNREVHQSEYLTYVFPIIFFLVSVLVILTTLSQLILKSRPDIGTLKAIGVKKRQIYLHYSIYGMSICALGSILGFFIGPLFIPNVLGIKYTLLWDIPFAPVHFFYPLSICITLILILLAFICSFLISHSLIKEKPVATLRPKEKNVKFKAKNEEFLSKKTNISWRLALRNILMNKGKSLMVVLGLFGCTSLLVCGFGIMDTLNYDIALDYGKNVKMDILIVPGLNQDAALKQLKDDERVKNLEGVFSEDCTLIGESNIASTIYYIEAESNIYSIPVYADGITIDAKTAEDLGVNIGDTLTVIEGSNTSKEVIRDVFETSFLFGIYKVNDEEHEPSLVYVQLEEGVSRSEFKEEISTEYNFLSINTKEDIDEYINSILSSIMVMTNVIKAFAIVLSIVVIYNLTSLNITERTREIATLKVLGFRFKEIAKTLTYEMMVDVFIGTVLGLIAGYPLTVLVLYVNQTNLLNFVYHIYWYTYLIAFIISFVVSILVSYLLSLKMKKISMSESLKSIE